MPINYQSLLKKLFFQL